MKILVVCQYFYPENFRINDVCFRLAEEGHDVTVLTGLPNYPEGIIKPEYRNFKRRKEEIRGVKVIRVPLVGRGKGKVRLLLNYFSYTFFATFKALTLKDFDVVYAYQLSPVIQVIPAYFVRKSGKKVINCLDLWPESITAIGMKTEGTVYNMIKKLSSSIYRRADEIITPSRGFDDYLVDTCGVKREKIKYLPSHAEQEYLSVTEKQHFTNEKLHLLFAGNIGRAQNLDIIVEALSMTDKSILDEIIVDIVGDGSYLETLKINVENKQLNEVFAFHGRCDIKDVVQYYEVADACLMTLEPNSFVSKTVPAKLQGYMASGRVVIGAINGSAADMIKEANCGVVVAGDDAKGLSQLITEFVQNRNSYAQYGQSGRQYFLDNFTIDKHITKLISYWEEK